MMKRTAILSVLLLTFAACDGGGSKTGSASTAAASAAKLMTDAEIEAADIPVEEDFEEEAFNEINDENLDAKVDELAKEIAGS